MVDNVVRNNIDSSIKYKKLDLDNSTASSFDKVSNKAKTSETTTTDDSKDVEYKITSDYGKENEAQKEVEQAKKDNKKLQEILKNLVSTCETKDKDMNTISKKLEELGAQIDKTTDENGKTITTAKSKISQDKENATKLSEEITQKQKTIQSNKTKIELAQIRAKNGDSSYLEEAQNLKEENASLGESISDLKSQLNTHNENISNIVETSQKELTENGQSVKEIANSASEYLKSAGDASEYADVTIEKGYEASSLKLDKWKDNGFSVSSRFFKKNDEKDAIKLGNKAMSIGSDLGNKASAVGSQIQSVAENYNIKQDNSISKLADKSYVNTDEMSNLKDLNNIKNDDHIARFNKSVAINKARKQNNDIYNDIGSKVKENIDNEKKKAEEAKNKKTE